MNDLLEVTKQRVAELEREVERLRMAYNDACADAMDVARELAALKAQPSGVILPERKTWNQVTGREGLIKTEAHNRCLDEVARLNQQPPSSRSRGVL